MSSIIFLTINYIKAEEKLIALSSGFMRILKIQHYVLHNVQVKKISKIENKQKTKILLNYISLHHKISSSTVCNFETISCQRVGSIQRAFNTFCFHIKHVLFPHSNPNSRGLSENNVLCGGSWYNKSIWQNLYHKEIIRNGKIFQAKAFSFKIEVSNTG